MPANGASCSGLSARVACARGRSRLSRDAAQRRQLAAARARAVRERSALRSAARAGRRARRTRARDRRIRADARHTDHVGRLQRAAHRDGRAADDRRSAVRRLGRRRQRRRAAVCEHCARQRRRRSGARAFHRRHDGQRLDARLRPALRRARRHARDHRSHLQPAAAARRPDPDRDRRRLGRAGLRAAARARRRQFPPVPRSRRVHDAARRQRESGRQRSGDRRRLPRVTKASTSRCSIRSRRATTRRSTSTCGCCRSPIRKC